MENWEACLHISHSTDLVENGVSYERIDFDFSPYSEAVLPHDSQVHNAGPGESPAIFVQKIQDYQGTPPRPIKISGFRGDMGLSYMESGPSVAFATFGTWTSDDGGGILKLRFRLPADLARRPLDRLSGLDSMANLTPEGKLGPSYSGPAAGWTLLDSVPDLALGRG